ncbi:hypothetical protein F1880_001188 [Penicillium rolfsii]|nr:hypothetical protein F1880_001188 [Penicillium rolfsii]
MPASCSYTASATLTEAIPFYRNSYAEQLIRPAAIVTSTETFRYITNQITFTRAMLDPSDVPSSKLASVSSQFKPARYTSCVRNYNSGGSSSRGPSGSVISSSGSLAGFDEFTLYIGGSAFSGGYCCTAYGCLCSP